MNQLTIRDILPAFYKNYNFEPDGGLSDYAVKLELFKGIFLYLPNLEARKNLILKHDIHHLVTGYTAVMKGETEISTWELSTGCTHNWFAFMINTYSMMTGFPFNLKGIWKAWLRGKSTKNLYHTKYSTEELLDHKPEALKAELGLLNGNTQAGNILPALFSFIGFLMFGTLFSIISVVLIPPILIYSLYVFLRKSWQKP